MTWLRSPSSTLYENLLIYRILKFGSCLTQGTLRSLLRSEGALLPAGGLPFSRMPPGQQHPVPAWVYTQQWEAPPCSQNKLLPSQQSTYMSSASIGHRKGGLSSWVADQCGKMALAIEKGERRHLLLTSFRDKFILILITSRNAHIGNRKM